MPRPASDWITLVEAAAIFEAANITISRSTLARWVQTGRLQSVRPGRRIYVRRAEVRAMLRPSGHRGAAATFVAPPGGFFDDVDVT
jgi:excisionase family DNA binding protein